MSDQRDIELQMYEYRCADLTRQRDEMLAALSAARMQLAAEREKVRQWEEHALAKVKEGK